MFSYLHELVVFFGGGEEAREDAQLGQQLPLVLGLALLAVLQATRQRTRQRQERAIQSMRPSGSHRKNGAHDKTRRPSIPTSSHGSI